MNSIVDKEIINVNFLFILIAELDAFYASTFKLDKIAT
jgi:hypothetical protein